ATTGAGPFSGAPTPGIWLSDTDALTVTNATTQDGVILIDAATTAAGTLTATNVVAGGTGRNVRLQTITGGAVAVGVVSAAGNSVRINAAGAVTGSAGTNITALNLNISAGTGVGAVGTPLTTTVSNLAVAAGTGGVFVANTGALTLTSLTTFGATVTGVTGGGAATISAGPITVASNVVMGGNLNLTTGETNDPATAADRITVNAGILVQSTGGTVTLDAGDDVIVQGSATVQANGL